EGEGDLRMTLEDAAEVPALDAETRGRLDRTARRAARELVEERHLAEDVAALQLSELVLVTLTVLHDLDAALLDDERADAGVTLTHDLLAGRVVLFDRGVRDRLERTTVEVLEQGDALQEIDVALRHAAGA